MVISLQESQCISMWRGGGGGGGGGNAWTIPFLSSSKDINDVTGEGTYSLIHSQRDTTNSNDNLTSLTRSSEEGGGRRGRGISQRLEGVVVVKVVGILLGIGIGIGIVIVTTMSLCVASLVMYG